MEAFAPHKLRSTADGIAAGVLIFADSAVRAPNRRSALTHRSLRTHLRRHERVRNTVRCAARDLLGLRWIFDRALWMNTRVINTRPTNIPIFAFLPHSARSTSLSRGGGAVRLSTGAKWAADVVGSRPEPRRATPMNSPLSHKRQCAHRSLAPS